LSLLPLVLRMARLLLGLLGTLLRSLSGLPTPIPRLVPLSTRLRSLWLCLRALLLWSRASLLLLLLPFRSPLPIFLLVTLPIGSNCPEQQE
jgi:hypothetical protein